MFSAVTSAYADQIIPLNSQLQVQKKDNVGAYFDGNFEIDLSGEAEDVLRRGIALNFILDVQVEKKRWYWLDKTVVDIHENMRLSFNPLTRQYRVSIGGMTQNLDTLDQALQLMSAVTNLQVSTSAKLNSEDYEARARLYLDTSRLPKPFQVTLRKGSGWNLDTGWFTVKIDDKVK